MPEDLLTVAQAAALLHVEPQDIWRRIEQGSLRASTLLTANGTSYLLERAVLFPEEQRGEEDRGQVVVRETEDGSSEVPALQSPDQQARLEEFVRRLLDPLASRLEDVSIELGREREQRASVEQERQLVVRQLGQATEHMIALEARASKAPSRQELEAQAEIIAELRRRSESAEGHMRELEARVARQRAELESYESTRGEISRLQAAERSLRQEIAQRAEAMAGLRRRAEEAERRLGDTQQELSQHSAAGAEYERARQATEQLRRQVKQLEQDGAALTERLNDFQQQAERAETRAEDLARQLAQQAVDLEGYDAARKEVERLQQYVKALESNRSTEPQKAPSRRGWRFWRRTAP